MSEESLIIPRKKSWSTRNQNSTGNERLIIINNGGGSGTTTTPANSFQPNSKTTSSSVRKVPVLYYLSRNGHLEHPHLINVPLSSPRHGLYLKDVINTLNHHRGKGIANTYSWSFKRSYRSGYVWHDASEDDLIQPTNGHDYVIKGSELLQTRAYKNQSETYLSGDNFGSATAEAVVRRNQSWSSFDNPAEYSVVKCESSRELAAKFTPDAAEQRRQEHVTVEISSGEIPSPPPSNSSSEVMEAVNGSRYVDESEKVVRDSVQVMVDQDGRSGRMKVSQVLMQLITCGGHGGDSVRHVSKQDEACQVGGVKA